jgi:predicted membrane channel-forming protein YqfA (hemolysin III family)
MDYMRVEPSWRQPFGIFLILLLIAGWAVLVASVASWLDGLPRWLHIIYYLVAGIVWIFPLRPLLRWMETGRWGNGSRE